MTELTYKFLSCFFALGLEADTPIVEAFFNCLPRKIQLSLQAKIWTEKLIENLNDVSRHVDTSQIIDTSTWFVSKTAVHYKPWLRCLSLFLSRFMTFLHYDFYPNGRGKKNNPCWTVSLQDGCENRPLRRNFSNPKQWLEHSEKAIYFQKVLFLFNELPFYLNTSHKDFCTIVFNDQIGFNLFYQEIVIRLWSDCGQKYIRINDQTHVIVPYREDQVITLFNLPGKFATYKKSGRISFGTHDGPDEQDTICIPTFAELINVLSQFVNQEFKSN